LLSSALDWVKAAVVLSFYRISSPMNRNKAHFTEKAFFV